MTVRIAVLTVSDRASRGEYEDLGGPAVKAWLERVMSSPAEIVVHVIPDGLESVRDTLIRLCDEDRVDMVLTTGGTELMRKSVEQVPTAILSRRPRARVDRPGNHHLPLSAVLSSIETETARTAARWLSDPGRSGRSGSPEAAPIIAATAVSRIGLKRIAPASIRTGVSGVPGVGMRMKSTSRIELRTMMPASAMKPIIEVAENGAPNSQ
jgi:hypothetical protein